MQDDQIEHVGPGDEIGAAHHNLLIDAATRLHTAPGMVVDSVGMAMGLPRPAGLEFRRFELAEDMPQWLSHSGYRVWRWACEREWDPSANQGYGGYVTNNEIHFKVADLHETGWFGEIGAKGLVVMQTGNNGEIGIIHDMVCPPECPCGDFDPDYDEGYCDEYSP